LSGESRTMRRLSLLLRDVNLDPAAKLLPDLMTFTAAMRLSEHGVSGSQRAILCAHFHHIPHPEISPLGRRASGIRAWTASAADIPESHSLTVDRSWPAESRRRSTDRNRPTALKSDFSPLCEQQRVFHIDTKIPNGVLDLGVTEHELHRSQVPCLRQQTIVPQQRSTGGKIRLGRVRKMGQADIRKLLIVGAMSQTRWIMREDALAGNWLGGADMDSRPPGHEAIYGAQLQYAATSELELMAETFTGSRTGHGYQAGIRWPPGNRPLDLDILVREDRNGRRARAVSPSGQRCGAKYSR
jgi:hypothetical protein